jgi:hypothetical protein
MSNVGAQKARWTGFGLVRDAQGRPKFDSTQGIPPEIWRLLTADEQAEVLRNGGYPFNGRS